MIQDTPLSYLYSQIENLSTYQLEKLCQIVLNDKAFLNGYGAKSHHHNFQGGLLVHTAEVLENCLSVHLDYLDKDVLIVAAIWHDFLKKKDYALNEQNEIVYTTYKEQIHHISGGWAEFYHQAKKMNIDEKFIERVGHCLLSHHGRKEYGSPVIPQTPEASILHWADSMSAFFQNGKYKEKTV